MPGAIRGALSLQDESLHHEDTKPKNLDPFNVPSSSGINTYIFWFILGTVAFSPSIYNMAIDYIKWLYQVIGYITYFCLIWYCENWTLMRQKDVSGI